MAPESHDRKRMRDDLRELAKLAKSERPSAPSTAPHAFESADSSGYVDLSAYSASDPQWVERELARASARAPASSRARTIDALAPESMAPVSLEALTASDEGDTVISARRRRRLFAVTAVAIGACAAVVALVAVKRTMPFGGLGLHAAAAHVAAPAAAPSPSPVPAPPVPPPTAATTAETRAPEATPAATAATASAESAPTEATRSTARPATPSKRRSHGVGHAHPAAAPHLAPTGARATAAPHAAPSAAHKGAGGDSLMDLIKQSVSSGGH